LDADFLERDGRSRASNATADDDGRAIGGHGGIEELCVEIDNNKD
jgi:hypothetical protein